MSIEGPSVGFRVYEYTVGCEHGIGERALISSP